MMASIRKQNNQQQARPSRKEYLAETKTFSSKPDTAPKIRSLESDRDKGCSMSRAEAKRIALSIVPGRYLEANDAALWENDG